MQESSIIVPSAFIDCQRQIREKNMLTQFRIHYPQGSIVSELVTVDHGKYVVRTLVQVEGVTLATGLAAADTVEQAEDRARERSLAILNLSSLPQSPAPIPESTAPQQSEAPAPFTLEAPMAESQIPSPTAPDVSETPSEPNEDDFSPNGFQLSKPEPEPPERAASFEDSTAMQEPPTPPDEPEDERFSFEELEPPEPIPAPKPAPASTQWSQPDPVANGPIDFSDVIAKTNVEMKRLGWTNEQGRKYLLETYGKRSRQLLSDEELLDFLRYLESLS